VKQPPDLRSHDAAAIEAQLRDDYARFQYAYVTFIADHLADVSRSFGGDLQPAVILAILGQRYLQARAAEAAGASPLSPAMAAARIADATAIPRETVRRKLAVLQSRGWVRRLADGSYTLAVVDSAAPARADLHALDERGIGRAARLLADLRGML
jgi:hypothetical protein